MKKINKYEELKRVIKRLQKNMVKYKVELMENQDMDRATFISGGIVALDEIKRFYQDIDLGIGIIEEDIKLSSEILADELKSERKRQRYLKSKSYQKEKSLKYLKPRIAKYGKKLEETPNILIKIENL